MYVCTRICMVAYLCNALLNNNKYQRHSSSINVCIIQNKKLSNKINKQEEKEL